MEFSIIFIAKKWIWMKFCPSILLLHFNQSRFHVFFISKIDFIQWEFLMALTLLPIESPPCFISELALFYFNLAFTVLSKNLKTSGWNCKPDGKIQIPIEGQKNGISIASDVSLTKYFFYAAEYSPVAYKNEHATLNMLTKGILVWIWIYFIQRWVSIKMQ